ncbi:sulfatase-like hydrolase/transferase [Paenibacillus sp. GCM10027627]|uniref:sulfatase-like hydrolase/transferase n=1 Tax=unclassified Paenibacillus TaxID=185978 RepID=UPI003634576B
MVETSRREPDRPNILVLLVDEERYPPVYENEEIKEWRRRNLTAQNGLRQHAVEFRRHYIGSSACSPSRATLFTGHYPSLHGVSQTTGIAKEPFDSDMFWLDRNTVPTMGDYFREGGYQTHYRGKWHISYPDIINPGTHDSIPSYDTFSGVPNPKLERLYQSANRLDGYGFSGWIGPEPHGKNPRNSASSAGFGVSGRDPFFAAETVELLTALDLQKKQDQAAKPWLVVCSLVNPHDIVLYGSLTERMAAFRFQVDPDVPDVAPPPTLYESLQTKPRCQASYRDTYPKALQPIWNQPFYRRLYYQLQKNADQQMAKVIDALARTSFYDDTIVVFASDHGDLLGAHGHLFQKFYCAYEEFLHVPILFHNKRLFPGHSFVDSLTSHIDLVPTLLGLAGIDAESIRERLKGTFSEARKLVGRDLSPWLLDRSAQPIPNEPIYFMTDDDVTRGQHQVSPFGVPYASVVQPNRIETVIAPIPRNGKTQLWKYSRYFAGDSNDGGEGIPDEYELYNLSEDPLEVFNLAHSAHASPETMKVQKSMMRVLEAQRKQKRLLPEQPGIS